MGKSISEHHSQGAAAASKARRDRLQKDNLVFRGRRGGSLLLEWNVLVRDKAAAAGSVLEMEK